MFFILQKFYKLILFWFHEITKRRVANGTNSIGYNSIFADNGNSGTKLGVPFITSRSFHFINQTDLEQYLFKLNSVWRTSWSEIKGDQRSVATFFLMW